MEFYTLIASCVINYNNFQKIPGPLCGSRYLFRKYAAGHADGSAVLYQLDQTDY